MVRLSFGTSDMIRRERPGSSFAIIDKVPAPVNIKKLTIRQEKLLRSHKNRSQKHLEYMRRLMLRGISFEESHKRAMRHYGK